MDLFLAAIAEGDLDGDIPPSALDELRALIEGGGDDAAIAGWFASWFDRAGGLADAGDRIGSAACKQACRRLPGVLPSQCRRLCKKVAQASRLGFQTLCRALESHQPNEAALCWRVYCLLWPSHC